jgi:hypothetical protein
MLHSCHDFMEHGYGRVLVWWPDLLDFLILRVATFNITLLHTHRLVSTVTSSLPLFCSGFEQRTFPFLWLPEQSPCLSYQLLTATDHNDWAAAVHSLTHQPTDPTLHSLSPLQRLTQHNVCAAYNITARTAQKKIRSSVAVYGPSPGNVHCLVCFAVVA